MSKGLIILIISLFILIFIIIGFYYYKKYSPENNIDGNIINIDKIEEIEIPYF